MTLRIVTEVGRELAKVPLKTNRAGWQEVPFAFTAPATDRQASLEIVAMGTGSVLVDFISLMRASSRATGKMRPDLLAALAGLAPPFLSSAASVARSSNATGAIALTA